MRGPDAGLAMAMMIAMGLLALLGAAVGFGLTMLLAKFLPRAVTIPLGIVLTLGGAVTCIHVVFPDTLRAIWSEHTAPTYHFVVPEGFTGRFTLVLDPAGIALTEHKGRVEIPVPPDRRLRVRPSEALEHPNPRFEAERGGAPVALVPDQSGQQDGVRYLGYYVGTWEQRDADPTPPRLR